jgi:hypothetical protein
MLPDRCYSRRGTARTVGAKLHWCSYKTPLFFWVESIVRQVALQLDGHYQIEM